MKRDMDLVRELLIGISEGKDKGGLLKTSDYTEEQVKYHLKIMSERGLVDVKVTNVTTKDSERRDYMLGLLGQLTWEGQDFLQAIEEQTVWDKTKTRLQQVGGSASMAIVKTLAQDVAGEALGLK